MPGIIDNPGSNPQTQIGQEYGHDVHRQAEQQEEAHSGDGVTAKGKKRGADVLESQGKMQKTGHAKSIHAGKSVGGTQTQGADQTTETQSPHATDTIQKAQADPSQTGRNAQWSKMNEPTLNKVMNGEPVLTPTEHNGFLPDGSSGTGNRFFAPSIMTAVVFYLSKVMQADKFLAWSATQQAINSEHEILAVAKDQQEQALIEGRAQANSYIAQGVSNLVQAGMSAIQVGASLKATSQAMKESTMAMQSEREAMDEAEKAAGGKETINKYNKSQSQVQKAQKEIAAIKEEKDLLTKRENELDKIDSVERDAHKTQINDRRMRLKQQEQIAQKNLAEHKEQLDLLDKGPAGQPAKGAEGVVKDANGKDMNAVQHYNQKRQQFAISQWNQTRDIMNTAQGKTAWVMAATQGGSHLAEAMSKFFMAKFALDESIAKGQQHLDSAQLQILLKGLDADLKMHEDEAQQFFAICDFIIKLTDSNKQSFNQRA